MTFPFFTAFCPFQQQDVYLQTKLVLNFAHIIVISFVYTWLCYVCRLFYKVSFFFFIIYTHFWICRKFWHETQIWTLKEILATPKDESKKGTHSSIMRTPSFVMVTFLMAKRYLSISDKEFDWNQLDTFKKHTNLNRMHPATETWS